MKIASKQPQAIRSNVYVTSEIYECWYAKPVSLGKIHKQGDYWYTEDGHRHVSSRDALNYLIRMTETTTSVRIQRKETFLPAPSVRKRELTPQRSTPVDLSPVNQSHPMFQEFLEFMDFKARRKMRHLQGAQLDNEK